MANEEEIQFHTPEVPNAPPIDLDPARLDYHDDEQLLSLATGGVMKLELEEDVVVSRIARDIYSSFRSGFREMYANAVTACLTAKETFGAEPRIEITLDPLDRVLQITEFDSTGISTDVFREIYLVLGRSGNLDGGKLGQYGFGKVAYTTLSDRIYIATKFRTKDGKNGEFAVEGRDGREYVLLPRPKLKDYGTSVKIILDEKVDLEELAPAMEQT
jgi:hypothetical protein